ncbi:MAG: tetratricopeptide repeat protein [Actinobacteria bacterium]|nr:MAG: tetratricopeptide repeat protein [Actinomycetota bacterium]
MTRGRIALGSAAALIAAAALLLGGVLRGPAPADSNAASARIAPESLTSGFSPGGTTTQLVERLQTAVRAAPQDVSSLDLLGLAYQQRARETGDPAYYTKSDGVLRRALSLQPNDLFATSGLGSLALSRHRFRDALALGRRAHTISPSTARNYGVIGDALVELGRYREAFAAYDRMGALKPSLASYARIGHARELLGDVPGAIQAMRLALDAASGEPEAAAWTSVQLGKIYWATGRLGAAGTLYRAALARFPGYVYGFDALAQVEAARGHLGHAIALEQRAVDTIPLPQFVSALGDMYRLAGNERQAGRQYALIGVIQRLLVANGVKTDLETALFDIDHAIGLRHALALARLAHADRPSIDGDDVLGWALARNGRCAEALPLSRRALRLGTQDALKFFHRGAIERCLGHGDTARAWLRRALALNPHFSLLWAPVARKWLS